jgi:hypothetical protein
MNNNIHTASYLVMNAPQRPDHIAPVISRMAAGVSEQTRTKTHGHSLINREKSQARTAGVSVHDVLVLQ